MDTDRVYSEIDTRLSSTKACDTSLLPQKLIANLNRWNWGGYGWISPVSLMITAAWKKAYDPAADCCKIWSDDELGHPIPGAYSIRVLDETITIPLFAKYDLCKDFCSPNSGMQGSRAIEKMRSEKRLNVSFASKQRTVFDLKLFASILNQINELNVNQCFALLDFFIVKAKAIKAKRDAQNASLSATSAKADVLDLLSRIHDPELTKCVVAACLTAMIPSSDFSVAGVSDYKTAADERAEKPGDLCVLLKDKPIMAVEVKDKSQTINWKNIERAKTILARFPSVISFVFVLENRKALVGDAVSEIISSDLISTGLAKKISIMSLHDLFRLAKSFKDDAEILELTNKAMVQAPALKPDSRTTWISLIQASC